MKSNTVIFECSGIGPKMLYSGSLGSKNLSKFSFRVLEFFKISRKSNCKIEIFAQFTGVIENEFFGQNLRFDHKWPHLTWEFWDPRCTLSWCLTNKLASKIGFKKWSRVTCEFRENFNFSSRFSRNFEKF